MDVNTYGNNNSVYDTILYLCSSPAFIWSAKEPRLLGVNENAARFFLHYPVIADTSEIDINKAIPDWRNIPNRKNNSIWLKFVDNSNQVKILQVRNSCLDPDENIWSTVLVDGFAGSGEQKNSSSDFYFSLDKLWSAMSDNNNEFKKLQSDLSALIIGELGLTDFVFLPSEVFEEFDLFTIMSSALDEKNGWTHDFIKKLEYAAADKKDCFVRHDFPDFSENQLLTWAFDTAEGKPAGIFCMEGLPDQNVEEAKAVCDLLSEKYKSLLGILRLRKDNYINKFENDVNGIINANINEGVIITDAALSIMYINPVAATMFGFSSEQVIGHKLEDLLVTSDGIQRLLSGEDGDGGVSSIKYLHRRSGKIFPCQIKACRMDSDFDPYNIFVLSDQTETEENRLKNEQLTQKAFLGDFASMLAHEIRNPINNIQMWIANLYNIADGNEAFLSGAKRVENDFQRITQLVDNILAFSKPMSLAKEEIDLSLLISEIIEKWRLNFARKNITCYFTPPQDFPHVFGDPRSLEQVFNNLIGNSVDAFDGQDGIITLKLSLRETESGRKQIVITESDNGPGIPEDKIDSIFEPFMTTKKTGNGWGLALSKRIITSHKGTIQVKSFQGGTVFEILLPLNEENG